MSYAENLKSPRWQKKRLKLLEAADWTCQRCGNKKKSFELHHTFYAAGFHPADYPDWSIRVLCSDCHKIEQNQLECVHEFIACFPELIELIYNVLKLETEAKCHLGNIFKSVSAGLFCSSVFGFDGDENNQHISVKKNNH